MKTISRSLLILLVLAQLALVSPAASAPQLTCGQILTESTLLSQDLVCPPEAEYALILGAPDITLDLGGHTISGHRPNTGVLSVGNAGLTIRNGAIEGFRVGVFIIGADGSLLEDLTVRNLESDSPDDLVLGIQIDGSQEVVVRDSDFEFLSVAHKEAVEIYRSIVDVNNIEVRGGGAGVNFSFAGTCDPPNPPSNGTVRDSRFSDVYIAGVEIACTSNAWIEGNIFTSSPAVGIGIQGDAPFSGDVTGVTIINNTFYDTLLGIELRGVLDSTISSNQIFDNPIWGIAVRQSLGCLAPELGFECFNSSGNAISGNQTWGNGMDLYHYEDALGNTWTGNTCIYKDGSEIPECTPPVAALAINYLNGKPGSFFSVQGANFPPDASASLSINGYALGSVPTDASGRLYFLLDTAAASPGEYTLTASVNPSASLSFTLDASARMRVQEGSGTIFELPGGLVDYPLHLPVVLK